MHGVSEPSPDRALDSDLARIACRHHVLSNLHVTCAKMQNSKDILLDFGEDKEELFSRVNEATAATFSYTIDQQGRLFRNLKNCDRIR